MLPMPRYRKGEGTPLGGRVRPSFVTTFVDSFNKAFTDWAEATPNPLLRRFIGLLHCVFLVTLFFAALFAVVAVAALSILPIMWLVHLIMGSH
jgi:hypothetical protein